MDFDPWPHHVLMAGPTLPCEGLIQSLGSELGARLISAARRFGRRAAVRQPGLGAPEAHLRLRAGARPGLFFFPPGGSFFSGRVLGVLAVVNWPVRLGGCFFSG